MFKQAITIFCFLWGFQGFTHGGEDHEEEPVPASQPGTKGNLVFMSKESQFLLKLETRVAKKEPVFESVQALGKISHRANGQQDLFATGSGRFVAALGGNTLIVGQAVKKGATLGYLEMIGRITLVAPFDGVVAFVGYHPGEWATAGSKLFTIVDPSTVWVEAQLFEKDLAKISTKSQVRIAVENIPLDTFSGKILAIGKTLDEQTRSTSVTIEVSNKRALLKIGQWAKVFIETPTQVNAVAIPKSALLIKEGVALVFVKKSAERFEGRAVLVDGENGNTVYVTQGLDDAQKVVTQGNYQLLPFLKTLDQ
jgi:biotin carboxyl carrier protein